MVASAYRILCPVVEHAARVHILTFSATMELIAIPASYKHFLLLLNHARTVILYLSPAVLCNSCKITTRAFHLLELRSMLAVLLNILGKPCAYRESRHTMESQVMTEQTV